MVANTNALLLIMREVPLNALSTDAFLDLFDGFSIGSNDLTRLSLQVGRDSETATVACDERAPVMKVVMAMAIRACRTVRMYVGIYGQGSSYHPDVAL